MRVVDGRPTCVRSIHAEENAIIMAPGPIPPRSIAVCTHHPCFRCADRLWQAGVTTVFYAGEYTGTDLDRRAALVAAGMTFHLLDAAL